MRELQDHTGRPLAIAERNALIKELNLLGMKLRGEIFDDDSLFRKTLRNTLTDEQLAKYAALERSRRLTMVEGVLQSWEQKVIGVKLSVATRRQLAELLIDKSRPPKSWGQYTHYIVLLQIAELEDEARPLLDDAQWDLVSKQLVQARRVEPQLRQMGIWPPAETMGDDEKE